jgi:hypothetical protein
VSDLPYRDFYYPLNVFMYILSHEEEAVPYLHYGIFENASDSIAVAQQRSTDLIMERLPPPPATILEVGVGLGTTLAHLVRMGYDAVGITPDVKQIAMIGERYGNELRVFGTPFEQFEPDSKFDCILFQESSQYIDAAALFSRSKALTSHIVVADEFALQPIDQPGALHSLERFLILAEAHGFQKKEELDLSSRARPSIDYFIDRLPRYREELMTHLGLAEGQIDDLIVSGKQYADLYRSGVYGYRLLTFRSQRLQSALD